MKVLVRLAPRAMFRSRLFLPLLILSPMSGGATERWVGPGGDDAGPGTQAKPWRTLARAAVALQPGDTARVLTGTYAERLVPTRSGTATAPITFAAAPGATPTIDGATLPITEQHGLVHLERVAWVLVEGFTVRNAGPGETATGILATHCDHVTIRRNRTAHTVSSGIGAWWCRGVLIDGNDVEDACHGGSQECISVAGCDGFEVRNNVVHDCIKGEKGGEGIDAKHGANGTVHHNLVHHIGRLGIYVDAWDTHTHDIEVYANLVHHSLSNGYAVAAEDGGMLEHIRVYDNVAYLNGHFGLTVASWGEPVPHHPIRDVVVEHNTFVGNGTTGWGGGILLDNAEAERIVVRDNILAGNRTCQLAAEHPAKSFVLDHNLIDAVRGGDGELTGEHPVQVVPRFRDTALGGVELEPGSPGMGLGARGPIGPEPLPLPIRP